MKYYTIQVAEPVAKIMPNSMWGKFDLQLNKTRVKEFVDQVIIENLQVSSTRNHKTMDHPGIKQHPAKARMEGTFTLEMALGGLAYLRGL